MNKQTENVETNRRNDVGSGALLGHQLRTTIKETAKKIAAAKEAYETAWLDAMIKLAKETGYGHPTDAADIIMEEVEAEVYDNSAKEWERQITINTMKQKAAWLNEDIEAKIGDMNSKRGMVA
jgi:hypothetical protein